jgi:hypothetical protein
MTGINVEFLSINSKAFDVSYLMLGLGQEIIMSVPSLEGTPIKWFSDNDAVLKISANNLEAVMIADSVGSSTILIQDEEFNILKKIVIDVITEQATTLGLQSKSPVAK